jgi:transglutaminase-like putative cysteine protease
MWRLQRAEPTEAYLQTSPLIDFDHPAIREHLVSHCSEGRSEIDMVRETYEFVRDQVAHSWDIGSRRVTAKASDVLTYREGICYAKSHLLAALLRAQGIPAGICYQKLTLGDTPETGHCIHALNTVYLASLARWIRLDARGNRPGIDAQFSIDRERLAFPVRPEFGECDYGTNDAVPHPKIVETLAAHGDCRAMYAHHLPTDLD